MDGILVQIMDREVFLMTTMTMDGGEEEGSSPAVMILGLMIHGISRRGETEVDDSNGGLASLVSPEAEEIGMDSSIGDLASLASPEAEEIGVIHHGDGGLANLASPEVEGIWVDGVLAKLASPEALAGGGGMVGDPASLVRVGALPVEVGMAAAEADGAVTGHG